MNKKQYSYRNALTLRITKTTDWRDGRKIDNAKIQNNSVADSTTSIFTSPNADTVPTLATSKPTRTAKVVQSKYANKNLMHHTVRKNKKTRRETLWKN